MYVPARGRITRAGDSVTDAGRLDGGLAFPRRDEANALARRGNILLPSGAVRPKIHFDRRTPPPRTRMTTMWLRRARFAHRIPVRERLSGRQSVPLRTKSRQRGRSFQSPATGVVPAADRPKEVAPLLCGVRLEDRPAPRHTWEALRSGSRRLTISTLVVATFVGATPIFSEQPANAVV